MTLTSPATDYQVVDGLETVTYFKRTAEATFAAGVTVKNALRRTPGQDQTGKALAKKTVVWHLWNSQLSGITPQMRDRITDSSAVNWQVLKVDYQTFLSRYRLTCVREV